jgi:hypothetical protein
MSVALLAMVIVVALAIPVGTAQAVPLKKWCRDMGGESIGRKCKISGTAEVGSSLDLPPGNVLEIVAGGTLNNFGTLGTSGMIINNGTINNHSTINNNGNISNNGSINNYGTIINCGSITGASVDGNAPESCPT